MGPVQRFPFIVAKLSKLCRPIWHATTIETETNATSCTRLPVQMVQWVESALILRVHHCMITVTQADRNRCVKHSTLHAVSLPVFQAARLFLIVCFIYNVLEEQPTILFTSKKLPFRAFPHSAMLSTLRCMYGSGASRENKSNRRSLGLPSYGSCVCVWGGGGGGEGGISFDETSQGMFNFRLPGLMIYFFFFLKLLVAL